MAAGLTNRGISERLVISLGTADRHVHNILAKLGCNNRTEAAAFAWAPRADVPQTFQPPGVSIASPSAGPFVGRGLELQRLAGCLREAKDGHGRLAMVVGEPGIGKTRLIEEAARQAEADGFTVLWGRCYEGDWAPPYVPFAEALTALVRRADLRELRADLGFGGPPLARISPVPRERLPDLPEPASLGPNEEQFRIFDAVVQLLRATANRRQMLLVIDDLHWADAGTLNMLRYVSRCLNESRICLLTCYRDVELDRGHLLGETVAELRRSAGYERITLRGLAGVEVAEML
ncbi:MAG: AAA family ATPase, partial [Tepidiformaceae bacterium]